MEEFAVVIDVSVVSISRTLKCGANVADVEFDAVGQSVRGALRLMSRSQLMETEAREEKLRVTFQHFNER